MKSILLVAITTAALLLLSLNAHAQAPDRSIVDAEFEVQQHELEHRISQLGVEEGELELEKIELELKQTALRVEMRRIQTQMQRLQIERSQSRVEQMREEMSRGRGDQMERRERGPRRQRQGAGGQMWDQVPPPIRELNARIERLERAVERLTSSDDE